MVPMHKPGQTVPGDGADKPTDADREEIEHQRRPDKPLVVVRIDGNQGARSLHGDCAVAPGTSG